MSPLASSLFALGTEALPQGDDLDTIQDATIAELRRQNRLLLGQVSQLSDIVRAVPTMLASARMDQAQGVATRYDYDAHAVALAVR